MAKKKPDYAKLLFHIGEVLIYDAGKSWIIEVRKDKMADARENKEEK